ncbi:hypothetical protein K491DRAFT_673250 [Lophiostoma macrostomum CBS 122681]|uniref:Uncharacterized protein n=1 Tax=Lophiostoma macrostomum CBS 122681 TaxID=1314788 RepID=A0A6A6TT75_9PLEO|nr:hypothetical protein K491DRAFT_673250 [Lophiostoma macrostomum CBS 122681]
MISTNIRVLVLSALAATTVARPMSSAEQTVNLQERSIFVFLSFNLRRKHYSLRRKLMIFANLRAGCSATADDNGDVVGQPVLQDDGTVNFEQGTPTFHQAGSVTVDDSSSCSASSDDSGSDDSGSDDSGSDDSDSDDLYNNYLLSSMSTKLCFSSLKPVGNAASPVLATVEDLETKNSFDLTFQKVIRKDVSEPHEECGKSKER